MDTRMIRGVGIGALFSPVTGAYARKLVKAKLGELQEAVDALDLPPLASDAAAGVDGAAADGDTKERGGRPGAGSDGFASGTNHPTKWRAHG